MVTPIMMYCHYDAKVCLHCAYVQYIVIDEGIKQQRTHFKLRASSEAKGGHFKLKL